jgi:hypothetical protein
MEGGKGFGLQVFKMVVRDAEINTVSNDGQF